MGYNSEVAIGIPHKVFMDKELMPVYIRQILKDADKTYKCKITNYSDDLREEQDGVVFWFQFVRWVNYKPTGDGSVIETWLSELTEKGAIVGLVRIGESIGDIEELYASSCYPLQIVQYIDREELLEFESLRETMLK